MHRTIGETKKPIDDLGAVFSAGAPCTVYHQAKEQGDMFTIGSALVVPFTNLENPVHSK